MSVHFVVGVNDIPSGSSRIVEVEGRKIGIYNLDGEFYALHNYCPHQGAELCKGNITGTHLESNVYEYVYGRDQEIVRCPWHGWEFDIKTGVSLFSDQIRTRKYEVVVENDQVGIVFAAKR